MLNRNIRIHTSLNDKHININLEQDFENIEILSLKINKNNTFYKTQTSNYGCVVGRVYANGSFGIPNAKISIFIEKDENVSVDSILGQLYPYTNVYGQNDISIRYNLLPEEGNEDCFKPVGTFASKRLVLDDKNILEIYDRYYKFTTITNDSGDYMLFGVPTGQQIIHYDLDISDCGALSQSPRDLIYKGYNINDFESPSIFKKSENIDSLPQIFSENVSIDVLPFWGDDKENAIAITRQDFKVDYTFEPTCVFLGSIITDNNTNGINKSCNATEKMGVMSELITGEGTIEMIRKTPAGEIEEYQVNGTQLIDSDGVWCYQIPMNLDYVTMDEYGNIIPTDNPDNGIPTRARVRFRFSYTENDSDSEENHLTKMLVPNNPKYEEDLDYVFGTNTKDDEFGTKSFRDLFWNNVYTVKSFIPRIQEGNYDEEKRFTGIKDIDDDGVKNPFPFNSLRAFNASFIANVSMSIVGGIFNWAGILNRYLNTNLSIGDGLCPDLEGWYYCPECDNVGDAEKKIREIRGKISDPESEGYEESQKEKRICVTNKIDYFISCIEENIAKENQMLHLDFYNDWINGVLYIPRWFASVRKKRSYRIGKKQNTDITIEACMENTFSESYRRYTQQCALKYGFESGKGFTKVTNPVGCAGATLGKFSLHEINSQKCHWKEGRLYYRIFRQKGGIHEHKTYKNESVYYFKPCEWDTMMADQHSGQGKDYRSDVLKRCPLFATDIVLLGTFDKCNKNGIKDVLQDLENTTYKLPSTMVETNMQVSKPMYTFNESEVLCDGSTEEGITTYEDTFTNYDEWSSRQDFADEEDPDMKEYAITLTSGVYWNKRGPKQSKNNLDNVFFPGGHFIGIDDLRWAHTNIKSCVNVGRMCEIGVSPSSRKSIIIDKTDKVTQIPSYEWAHIVPNGLISKSDIGKQDFRTIFATLNHNGLKTKRNSENGRLEYDLFYLSPSNFSGELREKTGVDSEYQKYLGYDYGNDIQHEPEGKKEKAYSSTMEGFSKDYYFFRMGITDKEFDRNSLLKKYLFVSDNKSEVALPTYNNSFYFYFGLNKGKTALNKFFKEYYSPCPNPNDYNSRFTVDVKNIDICEPESATTYITITIYDMDGPYIFYLYDKNGIPFKIKFSEEEGIFVINESGTEENTYNKRKIIISGLTISDYHLVLGGTNSSSMGYDFSIKKDLPESVNAITFEKNDFKENVKYKLKIGEEEKEVIADFYSFDYSSLATLGIDNTTEGEEYSYEFYLTEKDKETKIKLKKQTLAITGEVYKKHGDGKEENKSTSKILHFANLVDTTQIKDNVYTLTYKFPNEAAQTKDCILKSGTTYIDNVEINFAKKKDKLWYYKPGKWSSKTSSEGVEINGVTRSAVGGTINFSIPEGDNNIEGFVVATTDAYMSDIKLGETHFSGETFYSLFSGKTYYSTRRYKRLSGGTIQEEENNEAKTTGFYLWEPNANYSLYAIYNCGTGEEKDLRVIYLDNVFVAATYSDVYYGTEDVTFRKADAAIKIIDDKEEINLTNSTNQNENSETENDDKRYFWRSEFTEQDHSRKYLKGEKAWIFKKGTFMQNSFYDFSEKNINSHFIKGNNDNCIVNGFTDTKFPKESGDYEIDIYHWPPITDVFTYILPINYGDYVRKKFDSTTWVNQDIMDGYELKIKDKTSYIYEIANKKSVTNILEVLVDTIYRPFYTRTLNLQYHAPQDRVFFNYFNTIAVNGVGAFSHEEATNKDKWELNNLICKISSGDGVINTIVKESVIKKNLFTDTLETNFSEMDYIGHITSGITSDKINVNQQVYEVHIGEWSGKTTTLEGCFSYTNEEITDEIGELFKSSGDTLNTGVSITEGKNKEYKNNIQPLTRSITLKNHFISEENLGSSSGTIYMKCNIPKLVFKHNLVTYGGETGEEPRRDGTPLKYTHLYDTEYDLDISYNNKDGFCEDENYWVFAYEAEEDLNRFKAYCISKYWAGINTFYYDCRIYTKTETKEGKTITTVTKVEKLEKYYLFDKIDLYTTKPSEIKNNQCIGIYDKQLSTLTDAQRDELLAAGSERNKFKYFPKHINEITNARWYYLTYPEGGVILNEMSNILDKLQGNNG